MPPLTLAQMMLVARCSAVAWAASASAVLDGQGLLVAAFSWLLRL